MTPRREHTPEELKAIMERYKDPEYMRKAIDAVAELILDEIMPKDNEVRLVENNDSYRKGGAE